MTSDNDRPTGPGENPNGPAALLLGLVFIMALLGIALVYNAGDIDSRTTAAAPNAAVTGSTNASPSRK